MASLTKFDAVSARQVFFEQTITRLVTYWSEHEAVQTIDLKALDEDRDNILKAIGVALNIPEAWNATINLIKNFDQYMLRRGQYEPYYVLLGKAIQMANEQKDHEAEITLTFSLANVCLSQSKKKETIQLYRRVIRLARSSGNRFEEAKAIVNLGLHFVQLGYWRRSEILICHALKIFEDIEYEQGLAHAYNYLGSLYYRQEKWNASEKHYRKAIQLFEKLNETYKLIAAYSECGLLHIDTNQPKKALDYFQKALCAADEVNATVEFGLIYMNLGWVYLTQADTNQAEYYFKKAKKIYLDNDKTETFNFAQTLRYLGDLYEAQEDYCQACQYYEAAVQRFQAMDNWHSGIHAIGPLAKCQILLHDFDSARKTIQKIEFILEKLNSDLQEEVKEAIQKLHAAMSNEKDFYDLKNNYTYRTKEQSANSSS